MNGHWFCSFCNDVVNIRKPVGRWDEKRGQPCPVCRNNSADWVKHTETGNRLSPERGQELFAEMKAQIANVPYPR